MGDSDYFSDDRLESSLTQRKIENKKLTPGNLCKRFRGRFLAVKINRVLKA